VDYTSVTSIMHCGHVITFLLHAATNVRQSVSSSEENGVKRDCCWSRRSLSGVSLWAVIPVADRCQAVNLAGCGHSKIENDTVCQI